MMLLWLVSLTKSATTSSKKQCFKTQSGVIQTSYNTCPLLYILNQNCKDTAYLSYLKFTDFQETQEV